MKAASKKCLKAEGEYPAAIACHVTDPSTVSVINYQNPVMQTQTRITATEDGQEQFVTDIQDGSVLGYKYFDFDNVKSVCLHLKGSFCGKVILFTS